MFFKKKLFVIMLAMFTFNTFVLANDEVKSVDDKLVIKEVIKENVSVIEDVSAVEDVDSDDEDADSDDEDAE